MAVTDQVRNWRCRDAASCPRGTNSRPSHCLADEARGSRVGAEPRVTGRGRREIDVLLAVDPRQVVGCAVSMRSMIDAAAADVRFRFHVMTHRVSRRDRTDLVRTAVDARPGTAISVSEYDGSPFEHLVRSKLITRTCYAPLLLADVLPHDVERCVYADCDLVVSRDISELWEVPLAGHTLGAVMNGSLADSRSHQQRLRLREPRYFNSGLLLIDVARWRALRVGERAAELAAREGDSFILHDQDALNAALQEDWIELPWYWNVWTTSDRLNEDSAAIFHFMGAPKPWHADYDGRFRSRFMDCLDRTPFRSRCPWNPLGIGRLVARVRRRIPYVPGALRVLRLRLRAPLVKR